MRALVAERDGNGLFEDAAELAARSGAGRDTLERLAWAGACDDLVGGALRAASGDEREAARREALWQLGVVMPGRPVPGGVQLALPLEVPEPPLLRELSSWEQLVADYGSTRMTLAEHPMALLRGELPAPAVSSRELGRLPHGRGVQIAGLVVARQRPATAKGVTFMLLEDEWGTINLIVAPPVYERHRLIVRAEPFVIAEGRLERREGTINVVVRSMAALERPDAPLAEVRQIEPSVRRETGRDEEAAPTTAALRAVLPVAHSFGRRGR